MHKRYSYDGFQAKLYTVSFSFGLSKLKCYLWKNKLHKLKLTQKLKAR